MSNYRQGDIITLFIEALTPEGQGISVIDNYKFYVPAALPNETIQARILEVHQNYARASLEKVLIPSSQRVKPPCLHFGKCGGCQLMHLPYTDQLLFKKQNVQEAFKNHDLNITVEDCIASPQSLAYRTKIQFPITYTATGATSGLYRHHSKELIPISYCHIQCVQGEKIRLKIQDLIACHTHLGLKNILIKNAVHTHEALVIFVTYGTHTEELKILAEELRHQLPEVKGVLENINSQLGNTILGEKYVLLSGQDFIHEKLNHKFFKLSAAAFFQVNPFQIENIYQKAISLANIQPSEIVVDAFCGVGTLSLFAADFAKTIYGIECIPNAIANAHYNAQLNKLSNCHFICDSVENALANIAKCDVLFLNPPRKGCDTLVLQAIQNIQPRSIIYISCNPQTLARNISLLSKSYNIETVQPYDMFPQTFHVETLVHMRQNIQ